MLKDVQDLGLKEQFNSNYVLKAKFPEKQPHYTDYQPIYTDSSKTKLDVHYKQISANSTTT